MPWVRAVLRGQKIYARADEQGALAAVKGRVEIRYKPNDGRRYDALASNLDVVPGQVLPDETCGPADAVEKAAAQTGAAASGARPAARAGSGGRASSASTSSSAAPAASSAVPEGTTLAYADGACSGNPGPAGLGVVLIDGPVRVEISEYLGQGTNNIGELTAILRAIENSDPKRPLIIRTDSQYSIGVLQKGWKAKANAELIAEVKDAMRSRKARIEYVPGHAGVILNERADQLARKAVETRKTQREEFKSSGAKPSG